MIEPKYQIGQKIFRMNDSYTEPKIAEYEITGILVLFSKGNGRRHYSLGTSRRASNA
jgi:hypothetical protein